MTESADRPQGTTEPAAGSAGLSRTAAKPDFLLGPWLVVLMGSELLALFAESPRPCGNAVS